MSRDKIPTGLDLNGQSPASGRLTHFPANLVTWTLTSCWLIEVKRMRWQKFAVRGLDWSEWSGPSVGSSKQIHEICIVSYVRSGPVRSGLVRSHLIIIITRLSLSFIWLTSERGGEASNEKYLVKRRKISNLLRAKKKSVGGELDKKNEIISSLPASPRHSIGLTGGCFTSFFWIFYSYKSWSNAKTNKY